MIYSNKALLLSINYKLDNCLNEHEKRINLIIVDSINKLIYSDKFCSNIIIEVKTRNDFDCWTKVIKYYQILGYFISIDNNLDGTWNLHININRDYENN